MSVIRKIKEQVSLLEYVGIYVALEQRGNSWWGLCPMHDDSKKSFQVWYSKPKQEWLWKCQAGCGGGDIINFYATYNNLPNRAALEALAKEFGIDARSGRVLTDFESRVRKTRAWIKPSEFWWMLAMSDPSVLENLLISPSTIKGENTLKAFKEEERLPFNEQDNIALYLQAYSLHPTKANKEKALTVLEGFIADLKRERSQIDKAKSNLKGETP